jgi:hypothetical protein
MKRVFFIILGIIFITSCGEVIPKPDPSPQPDLQPRLEERLPPINPPYTESCSDIPEFAALENAEANPYEIWIACLIKNHPDQQRPTMSYHPLLGEVARARADDSALNAEEWRGHTDGQGFGPDYYICEIGYEGVFCPIENPEANSVESGTGGLDPAIALQHFLDSPPHKLHVLGEHEYFRGQLYYGIGHAYLTFPPDYTEGIGVYIFIATHPPLDE